MQSLSKSLIPTLSLSLQKKISGVKGYKKSLEKQEQAPNHSLQNQLCLREWLGRGQVHQVRLDLQQSHQKLELTQRRHPSQDKDMIQSRDQLKEFMIHKSLELLQNEPHIQNFLIMRSTKRFLIFGTVAWSKKKSFLILLSVSSNNSMSTLFWMRR